MPIIKPMSLTLLNNALYSIFGCGVAPEPLKPCASESEIADPSDALLTTGNFDHARSFTHETMPPADVYVESDLFSDKARRDQLATAFHNARVNCGAKIARFADIGLSVRPKNKIFIMGPDTEVPGFPARSKIAAVTFAAAGVELYRFEGGINPSLLADPLTDCVDGVLPHEIFHNFQGPNIFSGDTALIAAFLDEGLAEYVRMEVATPLKADTIEERAIDITLGQSQTATLGGQAIEFDSLMNGAVLSLSARASADLPRTNIQLGDIDGPNQATCRELEWPKSSLLRGAYLCFFLDSDSPGLRGTLRLTTPAQSKKTYRCGDTSFIGEFELPLSGRTVHWTEDLPQPYSHFPPAVNSGAAYGTGACFWKEVETLYGKAAVIHVIKEARSLRMSSTLSITQWIAETIADQTGRNAVAIKDDIEAKLKNRFKIPEGTVEALQTVTIDPVCEE